MTTAAEPLVDARRPLLELLRPRGLETALFAITIVVATLFGGVAMTAWRWPLWAAVGGFLVFAAVPFSVKWVGDLRRFGAGVAILGILLVLQGFHGVEHIVQFVQNHILGLSLRASTGLLSPANAEWVHFAWNWIVLVVIFGLLWAGHLRNVAGVALVIWATAHTLEHTYLMVRYLQVLSDLQAMGITGITAQGLPGILGQDGWLARAPETQGTVLCRIPGLTAASRLDIHFGWNAGELILLVLAAHRSLKPTGSRWRIPRLGRASTGGGAR